MTPTANHGVTGDHVIDALRTHILAHGYPPSVRELASALGLRSTATVIHHLDQLAAAGRIRRAPGQARSIEVLDEQPPGLVCPTCGHPTQDGDS